MISQVPLEDRVLVTEDASIGTEERGCEAISAFDLSTGDALYRGPMVGSPGRMAATTDLSFTVAVFSNSFVYDQDAMTPFLYSLQATSLQGQGWDAGLILGNAALDPHGSGVQDIATMGGVAIVPDQSFMLVPTSAKSGLPKDGGAVFANRAPYSLRKYAVPRSVVGRPRLGRHLGSVSLDGVAVNILLADDGRTAHVITDHGTIHSIETATMSELAVPITLAPTIAPENYYHDAPIDLEHAALSWNGRYIVTNRGDSDQLSVTDVVSRSTWLVSAGTAITMTGGIAFNRGWINAGLMALHAGNQVVTYRFGSDARLTEMGRLEIPAPYGVARRVGRAIDALGPKYAIAWSGTGDRLIAASEHGAAEFAVIDVSDDGHRLRLARFLTACDLTFNHPNDIITANGFITPPAPPTATSSPTAAPTLTPSATATMPPTAMPSTEPTRTGTPTQSPPPTATHLPMPAFLPIALRETCTPKQRRVDAALVIDASSSMLEPAAAGGTKLDAAVAAARVFLDQLHLGAGDQAAVVAFNAEATLRAPLTSDRARLDAALAGITTARETRLDLGVAVARAALTGPERRPGNVPVMVVLTDGMANPVPAGAAVAEADRAKAAGVQVFTVGLGAELDVAALRAMASRPAWFYVAPDAAALAGIYRAIAVTIPCPAGAFWGRR